MYHGELVKLLKDGVTGFISCESFKRDVFYHKKFTVNEKNFRVGDRLSFKVKSEDKGKWVAFEIVRCEERSGGSRRNSARSRSPRVVRRYDSY